MENAASNVAAQTAAIRGSPATTSTGTSVSLSGTAQRRHARRLAACRTPPAPAASVGGPHLRRGSPREHGGKHRRRERPTKTRRSTRSDAIDSERRDHGEHDAVRDAPSRARHGHQPVDERPAPLLGDRTPRDDRREPAHQTERRHDEGADRRPSARERGERDHDERAGRQVRQEADARGRRRTRPPRTTGRSTSATNPAPAGGAAARERAASSARRASRPPATAASASNPARCHGAPNEPPSHPRAAPNNAAVPVAPSVCNASVPSQRARPPWTTGEMVSTIDSPQGPWSADQPAIADAATSATISAPSSTTLPVPGR